MNKLFYIISLPLCGLISCSSSFSKDKAMDEVPEIPVIAISQRDTMINTAYVANIQAFQNTEIRSRIHAFLEDILVDEGRPVNKGQALFQLSTSELVIGEAKAQANVDISLAEAKTAELEVERVNILVNKKVITQIELDLAKARLKAAEAKVREARAIADEAKLKKGYTIIRAPFDGIINRLPLKKGSLIDEGTMLTSITDIRSVFAYFSVSENEYLRFNRIKNRDNRGFDSVSLELSDGSAYKYAGIIETMNGEIDPSTGSLTFRARFANPQGLLKHGATGKVVLQADVNNSLLVPQKSTFEIQDRSYVFIVDKNNVIRQRAFEYTTRLGEYYLVKSGLKKGDQIVYEGIQNLREGTRIKAKVISMAALQTVAAASGL